MRNRSPHTSEKLAPQQRYAAPKSANPSRNNDKEAAIQLLSAVLGSITAVMVVLLDLDGVDNVVLVTVVVVLVVVAAGFSAGFAVGPVVGSPAAGLASAGDLSVLSPGTSPPLVSPAGGVAPRTQSPHAMPPHRRHPTRR